MRREYVFGETNVGDIAANGMRPRVERDRTAGEREAWACRFV
jgi:hypothetical protein